MITATPSGPCSLIAATALRTDFALRSALTRRSGQPNGDDGARLAVRGKDLRDLGGVEDDRALERAGVQDGLGHGVQCSCLIAGISRTPPRS
jgi:hypothetical protein